MKATIKCILIIILVIPILCIVNLLNTPYNAYAVELSSSARCMCVYEANTNRIIFEKNSDIKHAMASTTKIVTAIVAIENLTDDLDTKYVVPDLAVGIEGTSMYLKHGEEVSKRELLYGLCG